MKNYCATNDNFAGILEGNRIHGLLLIIKKKTGQIKGNVYIFKRIKSSTHPNFPAHDFLNLKISKDLYKIQRLATFVASVCNNWTISAIWLLLDLNECSNLAMIN